MNDVKTFDIPKNILIGIYSQAEKEYPEECCGWILRTKENSYRYVPSKNLQDKYHRVDPESYPRTAKDAFLIDALQLSKDTEKIQKEGGSLYCIVHSHIDVGAYFSEEDKNQMAEKDMSSSIYPAECYLVVSVQEKKVREDALFYFDRSQKDFLEAGINKI